MRRAWFLVAALVFGCGDASEDEPSCTPAEEAPDCQPLYAPTFDNLHAQTLAPTCSPAGGSCHASEGAQGGLVLETADAAFAGLQAHVEPGAPRCSELVERLTTGDPQRMMPPGAPLPDSAVCAFRQWIHAGAER